jgi:hypothetical protein
LQPGDQLRGRVSLPAPMAMPVPTRKKFRSSGGLGLALSVRNPEKTREPSVFSAKNSLDPTFRFLEFQILQV